MVYIYPKKVGEKTYYYLRASQRKEGKIVVKDIAYLGNSLGEVKKNLERLPHYAEKIRKAYRTITNFLESNRYLEKVHALKLKKDFFLGDKLGPIEACHLHFQNVFKKSPPLTQREIIKNWVVEFAYNTTSIEGNTIKLKEARRLLEDGRTPKNRTLKEIYDVQNTEKVFSWLWDSAVPLSHSLIVDIHRRLMENIDPRTGYRRVDVRVVRSNFDASPAPYVKTDLDLLLRWYVQQEKKLHHLVLASIFHHKFELIHPFMDGNGRTGRMLFCYILLKKGYPPTILHTKERLKYLQSLRKADQSSRTKVEREAYKDLVQFTAEEMISHYWNLFL